MSLRNPRTPPPPVAPGRTPPGAPGNPRRSGAADPFRRPPLPIRIAVHLAVYAVAATMLAPFLWMLLSSLTAQAQAPKETLRALVHDGPRWSNYAEAWNGAELDRFYLVSALVAVITTLLAVAYNALGGYAFAKLRFGGRAALFALTLATMMLPAQVFFVFAYVICDWLNYLDSIPGLVVPFLASGFGIFYMRQAISGVPDELLEAGRIDGMTELDLFWLIVRPVVWPAITALAIFTFMNSWNSFFWPLIVVDSLDMKTLPLAIADLSSNAYFSNPPVTMAAAAILILPLILVFFLAQKAFVRGVAMTGLKE